MLQAGSLRVRFTMGSLDFSNLRNPTSLESTQPLTEMSTRNLPGVKGRSTRKADNFTVIYEPIM
jgi:hypothetical protein